MEHLEKLIRSTEPVQKTHVFAFNEELTLQQQIIFELLVDNVDSPSSKEEIYQAIWDTDASFNPNTIELHVSRLRKKLLYPPQAIKTVRNQGYVLEIE